MTLHGVFLLMTWVPTFGVILVAAAGVGPGLESEVATEWVAGSMMVLILVGLIGLLATR